MFMKRPSILIVFRSKRLCRTGSSVNRRTNLVIHVMPFTERFRVLPLYLIPLAEPDGASIFGTGDLRI